MQVGVFTVILGKLPLERTLDYLAGLGVEAVELGAGGYARSNHCPLEALLASDRQCRELRNAIGSRGLRISALNAAGNPIHPQRKRAATFDTDFRRVIRLAHKLEV